MLHVEHREGDEGRDVVVLRLEHGKVNALDLELLERLAEAVAEVADSCLVLTGTGSSFSAGVDLRRILDGDQEHTDMFLAALSRALLAVFRHPRPVVAAINGHAIAGGCVLAAAADVRLMSAGSIGLTELGVGVPFPTAAIELIRYAVGPGAHRLALFADLLDPEQARLAGLVDGLCAPAHLLERAVEWAGRLGAVPPQTYALTKTQLHAAAEQEIARRSVADDTEVRRQWKSPPGRAAVATFLAHLDATAAARRT